MPGLKRKAPVYPWHYFDWCGPYISDGKFQSSAAGFTTARSAQEQTCKEHDIAYSRCKSRKCFEEADRKFRDDSWSLGAFGKAAGTAVYHGGPLFHGKYEEDEKKESGKRKQEDTPQASDKRLRGNPNLSGQKRPAESNNPSQRNSRRRLHFNPDNQSDPLTPLFGPRTHGDMGTQGEVGLKPFKKPAAYAPDYFTTKLKWIGQHYFQKIDRTLFKHEFRINSPLDPNYMDTDKENTRGNATVNGWSEYATRYKFYRVIGNRVHIKIHFPDDRYLPLPPEGITWTSLDTDRKLSKLAWPRACGVALNPARMFPYSDDVKVNDWAQFANSKFVDYTNTCGVNKTVDFHIDYNPLDWDTPVAEQQREVFWTPVTQNPLIADHFTVFIQSHLRSGDMAAGGVQPFTIGTFTVSMEFTIQFREWSEDTIGRSLLPDKRTTNDPVGTSQFVTGSSDTVMQT